MLSYYRLPPSSLPSDIKSYSDKVARQRPWSLLLQAEKDTADELLKGAPLLDWLSMSNFFMYFRRSDNTKKYCSLKSTQKSSPYAEFLLSIFTNPEAECFLHFVVYVELYLRVHILLRDKLSTFAKTPFFWRVTSFFTPKVCKYISLHRNALALSPLASLRKNISLAYAKHHQKVKGNLSSVLENFNLFLCPQKMNDNSTSLSSKKVTKSSRQRWGGKRHDISSLLEKVIDTQEDVELSLNTKVLDSCPLTKEFLEKFESFLSDFSELLKEEVGNLKEMLQSYLYYYKYWRRKFVGVLHSLLLSNPSSLKGDVVPDLCSSTVMPCGSSLPLDEDPESEPISYKINNDEITRHSHGSSLTCSLSEESSQEVLNDFKTCRKDNVPESISTRETRTHNDVARPTDNDRCDSCTFLSLNEKNLTSGFAMSGEAFQSFLKEIRENVDSLGLHKPLCLILDAYGITDSLEKVCLCNKLEGDQFCAHGKSYEENVLAMMPLICDRVAPTYAAQKGISLEDALAWIHCCLSPPSGPSTDPMKPQGKKTIILDDEAPTNESKNAERVSPPEYVVPSVPRLPLPAHVVQLQLPKLYYSTNCCIFSSFVPPSSLSKQPRQCGELDLIILEDSKGNGSPSSMDVLFIVEIKRNVAELGKALNQRNKLFERLDAAFLPSTEEMVQKISNNAGTVYSSRELKCLIFSLFVSPKSADPFYKPCRSSRLEKMLTADNFHKSFSSPSRRAHFIVVSQMRKEQIEKNGEVNYFASTGRIRNLLLETFASFVANKIYAYIFSDPSGKMNPKSPFFDFILSTIFDAQPGTGHHSFPSLPLVVNPLSFVEDQTNMKERKEINFFVAEAYKDPIRYALLLKKYKMILANDSLAYRFAVRFLHPFPAFTPSLPSVPSEETFIDALHELMRYRILRTLILT